MLTPALQSAQPLWALWKFSTASEATRLTMEFMGLANHRKALRAEIVYYAERFRQEQNEAIADALRQLRHRRLARCRRWCGRCSRRACPRRMVMERALGMSTGHAETFAFCERWLRRLEGEPPPEPEPGDAVGPSSVTAIDRGARRAHQR